MVAASLHNLYYTYKFITDYRVWSKLVGTNFNFLCDLIALLAIRSLILPTGFDIAATCGRLVF